MNDTTRAGLGRSFEEYYEYEDWQPVLRLYSVRPCEDYGEPVFKIIPDEIILKGITSREYILYLRKHKLLSLKRKEISVGWGRYQLLLYAPVVWEDNNTSTSPYTALARTRSLSRYKSEWSLAQCVARTQIIRSQLHPVSGLPSSCCNT